MTPILSDLEGMVIEAGKILKSGFGHDFEIHPKGVNDLVTEIDQRSEAFLMEEIQRHFPDHGLLTEESGVIGENGAHQWFIDPLDGTINYVHGVPIFSVSLAYAEDGQVVLGVVYDPMQEECFTAELGQGARLNGTPIHVSATRELAASLLVTGFPYDLQHAQDNNLDNFERFSLQSQGVRRLGSAALDLCYVAAGRFDGFWELRINAWDIAAGGLIAREAGALVTAVNGDPEYLFRPLPISILAANPYIYSQMLHLLHK